MLTIILGDAFWWTPQHRATQQLRNCELSYYKPWIYRDFCRETSTRVPQKLGPKAGVQRNLGRRDIEGWEFSYWPLWLGPGISDAMEANKRERQHLPTFLDISEPNIETRLRPERNLLAWFYHEAHLASLALPLVHVFSCKPPRFRLHPQGLEG